MPRQRRQDGTGVVHHVWAGGIDGRAIFLDDGDRHDWLHRLERIPPESGMRCFAWTLMSNHVHPVLQTGPVPLANVMKRIHTGYGLTEADLRAGRRCRRAPSGNWGYRRVRSLARSA